MISDPENPEWTEADFAKAKGPEALPAELLAAFPKTKMGRPKGSKSSEKEQVSLRIDTEVLERFRAGGPGWQTRMNEALRRAVAL